MAMPAAFPTPTTVESRRISVRRPRPQLDKLLADIDQKVAAAEKANTRSAR